MSLYDSHISHLRLGPLRGVKKCDLLNLGQVNVLCGKNNTGKSTLLEAASNEKTVCVGFTPNDNFIDRLLKANNAAIAESQRRSGHPYHIPLQDLPPVVRAAAQTRPAWFAGEEKELVELINQMVGSATITNLHYAIHSTGMIEHLEGLHKYRHDYGIYIPPTRAIETAGKILTDQEPLPAGTGVVNSLFHLHNQPPGSKGLELFRHIEASFAEVTDGYTFGVFSGKENRYALKFSDDDKTWIPAEHCGKGLQDLIIILYFALSSRHRLLLIEEPEVHLHPEVQRKLLSYLRSNTESQYVFSTHSSVYLDSTLVDRVFLTRFENQVRVLDATSKTTFLHDLGYSAVDNLVSDLIILVEGPSDVPVIEEFLRKKNLYDHYNIKLWPLGGDIMAKSEIDLSVFAQSHNVLALVDDDPGSGRVRKKFQEKCSELSIECIRLKRYSIENYFSLRALREVFGSQIREEVTEILPNEKLENQIGMNVKTNNRAIAREMTLEEVAGTDFNAFLDLVEALL